MFLTLDGPWENMVQILGSATARRPGPERVHISRQALGFLLLSVGWAGPLVSMPLWPRLMSAPPCLCAMSKGFAAGLVCAALVPGDCPGAGSGCGWGGLIVALST